MNVLTQSLLRVVIEHMQLKLGVTKSFFTLQYKDFVELVIPSWVDLL